jgi:hypothetical protein
VNQISKADKARIRAARLRNEARNCLSVAVGERDHMFAAQLIDEALLLMRRSTELAA